MEEARKQRRASGPVSRQHSKPSEGKWTAGAAAAGANGRSPQPPSAAGRQGAAGSLPGAQLEREGTSEQDLRRISRVLRSLRAQRAAAAAAELPPGLGTPPGLQQPSGRRRQYSPADYSDGSPDREAPRRLLRSALQQAACSPERQRSQQHAKSRRSGPAQQEAAAAEHAEQHGGRRSRRSRSRRRGNSASPTQAAAERAAQLADNDALGAWGAGERLAGGSSSHVCFAAQRQEWPSADTRLGDLRWGSAGVAEPAQPARAQQLGLRELLLPEPQCSLPEQRAAAAAAAWQRSQPADVSPELAALVAKHAPAELHLLRAAGARPRPRRGPRLTDLLGSGDSSSEASDSDSLALSPAPEQAAHASRFAAPQPEPSVGSEPGSPATEGADSLAFTVRDTSPVPSPEPPPAAERRLTRQSSGASERARAGAGVSDRLTRQHWHSGAERQQSWRSADGSEASRLSSDRTSARQQPQRLARAGTAGASVRRKSAEAADETSPDQHSKVRDFMRKRRAELAAAARAQAAGEPDPVLRRLQARKEAALAELERVRARREGSSGRRPAHPHAAAQAAAVAEPRRERAQAEAGDDAYTQRSLASHPISPVPTFREPAWGAAASSSPPAAGGGGGGGGSAPSGSNGGASAGDSAGAEPRIIRSLVFTLGGGRVKVSERRPADAPASGRLLAAARLMQNAARRRLEAGMAAAEPALLPPPPQQQGSRAADAGPSSGPAGSRGRALRLRLRLPEADAAMAGPSSSGAQASPGDGAAAGRPALPRLRLSPRAAVAAPRVSGQAQQAAATTGQQVAREQLWRMDARESHRLRMAAMASRVADLQARIAALAAMAAPTPRGEPSPRGCLGAAASPGMGLLSTRSLPSHVEAVLGAGAFTMRAPSPRLRGAAAQLALQPQAPPEPADSAVWAAPATQSEAQQQPAAPTNRAGNEPASAAEQLPALTPVQHRVAAVEAASASKRKFTPEPAQDSQREQAGQASPSPERPAPTQQPRSKLPRLGGSYAGAPAPAPIRSWADAVDAEPPSPAAPPAWLAPAAGSGSRADQLPPALDAAAAAAEASDRGSGELEQPESAALAGSRPGSGSGSEPASSVQAAAGSGLEAAAAASEPAEATEAADAAETREDQCAAEPQAPPLPAQPLRLGDSEQAADAPASHEVAELVQRRLAASEEQLPLSLGCDSGSGELSQLAAGQEADRAATQAGSSSSAAAAQARPGSADSAESEAVSSCCRDGFAASSPAWGPDAKGAQGGSSSSAAVAQPAAEPAASSLPHEPAWEDGSSEEPAAAVGLSSHSTAGSSCGQAGSAASGPEVSSGRDAGAEQPLRRPASAARAGRGGFVARQLSCSAQLCVLAPPGRSPAAADVPALEQDSSSSDGGLQADLSPSSLHSPAADAQPSDGAELLLCTSSSVSEQQAAGAAAASPAAASDAGSSCQRSAGAATGEEVAGESPGTAAGQQPDYWPLEDSDSEQPGSPELPAASQPSAVAGAGAQPEEAGSAEARAAEPLCAGAPAAESAAASSPVRLDPLEPAGANLAAGPAPLLDSASEQLPLLSEQAACTPPQPQQQQPAEPQPPCEPAHLAQQLGRSAEVPALEHACSSSGGSEGACEPARPAAAAPAEDSGSVGLSLDWDSSDEESALADSRRPGAGSAAREPAAEAPQAEQDARCSEDSGGSDWQSAAAGESPHDARAAASQGSEGAGAVPAEPPALQQDEAHAQAYAARCLDAFFKAGEWSVQPGKPAIGAGAYLAMERAAPAFEAQHMHNKALFDAVNESLALLLQPGRAAAGPGRRRLARLQAGSPVWQAALRQEVRAALAAWCRPAAEDDFRALLLADMAQDEAELEACGAFAEEIEREIADGLWEALLADTAAAFCP